MQENNFKKKVREAYDWNEIGTSLEFTMKFFYYIMIVSKNIQTAKNT